MALGPGPFVTGLEYSTDTQATVVGKPEKTFFLEALRDLNCSPEEAVMIGDVSVTHRVIDTNAADFTVTINHFSLIHFCRTPETMLAELRTQGCWEC